MREVVVVGYARTPFGSFRGSVSSIPAPKLGAIAIEGALKKAKVSPEHVSEVIMGSVLLAGQGQAPARQAAIYADIPKSVPCLTINKVCGSGMKSVMLGMQSILLGDSEVVVAGGMENMSLAPFLLAGARKGFQLGNQKVLDSMLEDGLWDPYHDQHMGNCGELCAKDLKISRQEQDQYAIESYQRAQSAWEQGKFNEEVVPAKIFGKRGKVTTVEKDEEPFKADLEKLKGLRAVFEKDGTITAANASSINDGACAMVLTSVEKAKELGLTPLAKIVSYANFAQEPQWFTTAPATAMKMAMEKANWSQGEVDLFEVNEAFSVVALAAQKELNIDREKLNIWGGAVAIGHPIGASGNRITMTLISALKDQGKKKGVAGICLGGGEATALCVEIL